MKAVPEASPKGGKKGAGKRSVIANVRSLLEAKQALAGMRGRGGTIPRGGMSANPASFAPAMGGAGSQTN